MNIDLVNQTLPEMQHMLEEAFGDSVIGISITWCTSPYLEVHVHSEALDDFMAQALKSSCNEFYITVTVALERYFMRAHLDTVGYLFLLDSQQMKAFLKDYPEVPVEWGASDGTMEVLHVD